ncbi:MAG: hypothetical protein JSC189_000703 [Candidatus Tokpelaia sp. JSC189]|nr:MAG: hypothetical protein JSC189_000703 [Candidatus Tokpelaia sp. JSC189]
MTAADANLMLKLDFNMRKSLTFILVIKPDKKINVFYLKATKPLIRALLVADEIIRRAANAGMRQTFRIKPGMTDDNFPTIIPTDAFGNCLLQALAPFDAIAFLHHHRDIARKAMMEVKNCHIRRNTEQCWAGCQGQPACFRIRLKPFCSV